MLGRYDRNGDGVLQRKEWRHPRNRLGSLGRADSNKDGKINSKELKTWLMRGRKSTAKSQPIPSWFRDRDRDGDGQLKMSEFARGWTTAKVEEFNRFDHNRDGILTVEELHTPAAARRVQFSESKATLILPNSQLTSELTVQRKLRIADLNVQLSLSHPSVQTLRIWLVPPGGTRVILYGGQKVPGKGPIFDNTWIDDTPQRGTSLRVIKPKTPLSKLKRRPLSGRWKLVVHNPKSNYGIVYNWTLSVLPAKR